MTTWKSGQISLKIGSPAPAVRSAQADQATLAEIGAAVQARDFDLAAQLAERAVASGIEHPAVLNLAALKCENEERFEDAERLLQRAVALAPNDPAARNALGLCLRHLDRTPEALVQFDRAVEIAPTFAGAHGARGGALESLGRLTEAEAAFGKAIELQPDNLGALAGLANLMSRRGDHAQARPLALRVLDAQPGFPDAVNVAAAADLAQGAPAAAQARLEAQIAGSKLTPYELAMAQGLLGDVFDAQGKVAEAFTAYTECNMGLWRAYAKTYGTSPSALEFARGMIDRLREIPAPAWASVGEALPKGVEGHVFLLGFPRSGTTLLEQVLASHPKVEALEERETLADAMRAFLTQPDDLGRLAAATEAELAPIREAYWGRVREEGARPDGKIFVDKHPLNSLKLPLIAKLFPTAKILFARRDPRDVVLSCYRRRFAMSGSAYQLLTLPGAAGYYDAAMQIAELLDPVLAPQTLLVRHEALISAFDDTVKEVCDFLGLPWTDALRTFSQRIKERGVATPSGAQLAGGLSAEGIGQWRRYRQQLAPALPRLARWVERFGYEPQ